MAKMRVKFISKKLTELSVLYGLYSIDWDYNLTPFGFEYLLSHLKPREIWIFWGHIVRN